MLNKLIDIIVEDFEESESDSVLELSIDEND